MARLQKVIWHEGMTLDPQHFQQAERHLQAQLNFRLRARARYDWGFTELQISPEALANGQFALVRCKGVMPDGLVFNIPEEDRAPQARALAEVFPATAEKLDIYLALRREREQGGNCVMPPHHDAGEQRYSPVTAKVADDNLGGEIREVEVARANLVLRAGNEPLDDYTALKIAQVKKRPNGTFVVSEDFVPTCLSLEPAPNLLKQLNDLLSRLVSKCADFRGQVPFNKKEFVANDLTGMWLLNVLNTHIPVLNHYSTLRQCHPEELYLQLLALAGQLTTHPGSPEIRPVDFPRYEHDQLTKCFHTLISTIILLVNRVGISENYVSIRLRTDNNLLWVSDAIAEDLLQNAHFYLMCSGEIEERRITMDLVANLKIAPPESLHYLITYNLRGLNAQYTPNVPPGLPRTPGIYHFRLEKAGDYWEAIVQSRALAILIPDSFNGLKLELVAMQG